MDSELAHPGVEARVRSPPESERLLVCASTSDSRALACSTVVPRIDAPPHTLTSPWNDPQIHLDPDNGVGRPESDMGPREAVSFLYTFLV